MNIQRNGLRIDLLDLSANCFQLVPGGGHGAVEGAVGALHFGQAGELFAEHHEVDDVGADIEIAYKLMEDLGLEEVIYEQRNRVVKSDKV